MSKICKLFAKNYAISIEDAYSQNKIDPQAIDELMEVSLKLWSKPTMEQILRTIIRGYLYPEIDKWRILFYSWPTLEWSMDASHKLWNHIIQRMTGVYSLV